MLNEPWMKNFDKVKPAGEYESLPVGGYVIIMGAIENVESEKYLNIQYDIAEGDYKNYFGDRYEQFGEWPRQGYMRVYYTEKSARFFKGFITAVEESNQGYHFNGDERQLKNKLVGIVYKEREYVGTGTHEGELMTGIQIALRVNVDRIRKGDYRVPKKETLSDSDRYRLKNSSSAKPTEPSYFNWDVKDDIQFD